MSNALITDAAIHAALALAERATAGPWRPGRKNIGLTGEPFSSVYADDERGGIHLGDRLAMTIATIPGAAIPRAEEKANTDFIAAAREGWPAALRALLECRAALREVLPYFRLPNGRAGGVEDRIRAVLGEGS